MTRQKKILIQGAAAVLVTTVGLLALGGVLTAKQSRTVAFEYRSEPTAVELEPMSGKRPTTERRPPPEDPPPAAAGEPKNGDPPAGLLSNVATKMIDNAITTFWSVINALIVAITMRRYSKAGKEGSP